MNDANRRRFELVQQNQQSDQINFTDVDRHSSEIEYRLEHLQASVTQLEQNSQKYLTKTHLTPIISKLHQLQRQQKAIKLGQLKSLAQQVKELQQQIDDLDASAEALHESSQNWQQVQRQLVEIQGLLQTEAFSSKIPASLNLTRFTAQSHHRPQYHRIAIFIDAANLYHSALEIGIKIDYSKLLSILTVKSKVYRVFVYTGVDSTKPEEQNFLSWMQQQGYEVITKEVVRRADGSKKANLDVELALDMVNLSASYDTAILLTGDGDFATVVKRVKSQGKRVEVVSFGNSTSVSLIDIADSYLDLETIPDQISQSPYAPLAVLPPKHREKAKKAKSLLNKSAGMSA